MHICHDWLIGRRLELHHPALICTKFYVFLLYPYLLQSSWRVSTSRFSIFSNDALDPGVELDVAIWDAAFAVVGDVVVLPGWGGTFPLRTALAEGALGAFFPTVVLVQQLVQFFWPCLVIVVWSAFSWWQKALRTRRRNNIWLYFGLCFSYFLL